MATRRRSRTRSARVGTVMVPKVGVSKVRKPRLRVSKIRL